MDVKERPWLASPRSCEHTWMSLADYNQRRLKLLQHPLKSHSQVVFVGDSITEGWETEGERAWKTFWQPLNTLCLGIGGDQTQNLLWRIEAGELSGLQPKALLLLIGVNNLWWGGFTPEETQKGIIAVVRQILNRLPKTHVFVHSILPASRSLHDDLRQRISHCNTATKSSLQNEFAEKKESVTWIDLSSVFLTSDGQLNQALSPDFVHLSSKGYWVWSEKLYPILGSKLTAPAQCP